MNLLLLPHICCFQFSWYDCVGRFCYKLKVVFFIVRDRIHSNNCEVCTSIEVCKLGRLTIFVKVTSFKEKYGCSLEYVRANNGKF